MKGGSTEEASGGGIMDETSWRGIWRGHLEEASWSKHHGGGIMEETSLMRNHARGIMEEESWRKSDEESWTRNHGGGIM